MLTRRCVVDRSCRVAAGVRCLYVSLPKHAWHGWQVLSVQREMQKMQKEFDEGPTDDETAVTWTFEVVIECHRSRAVALFGPHFGVWSIRHGLPVARGYLLALL